MWVKLQNRDVEVIIRWSRLGSGGGEARKEGEKEQEGGRDGVSLLFNTV